MIAFTNPPFFEARKEKKNMTYIPPKLKGKKAPNTRTVTLQAITKRDMTRTVHRKR